MTLPDSYRVFANRTSAGRLLAAQLKPYAGKADQIVLALPRGGVTVGYEVANVLGAPLDVLVVRKLGVPTQPELAMGAIATGGILVLNEALLAWLNISRTEIDAVIAREQRELARRELLYRGDRPPLQVRDKTVFLVDDGIATGTTMRSAVMALQKQQPTHIVVAIPTASREACSEFSHRLENVSCVCLSTPEPFRAIGQWYDDFTQVTDEEVCELLARAQRGAPVTS
jgi:putative phosphoribosyl transferase